MRTKSFFGRGCRHSGITPLTGAFMDRKRFAPKFERPRSLVRMDGCCGIRATSIQGALFERRNPAPVSHFRRCQTLLADI